MEPELKRSRVFAALEHQVKELDAVRKSLSVSIPVLVTGPSFSGKTALIQLAAAEHCNQGPLFLNVGEQTDSKTLLGSYSVAPGRPGQFKWKSGVLFDAASIGRWLVLEDLHLASSEFLSIITPILDSRCIFSPMLGETMPVHPDFRLFATMSASSYNLPLSKSFWNTICLREFDQAILCSLMPASIDKSLIMTIADQLSVPPLLIVRLCERISSFKYTLDEADRLRILSDCTDLFYGHLPRASRSSLIEQLSHVLCIPTDRALAIDVPAISRQGPTLQIGRVSLGLLVGNASATDFVTTKLASYLLEQIACCVRMAEPVLLTGETGTGKTSIVQHLAKLLGVTLVALNMSQKSEASDLIGGYRPFSAQVIARRIVDLFVSLFTKAFSKSKNAEYLVAVREAYRNSDWDRLARLIKQIIGRLEVNGSLSPEWAALSEELGEFERCHQSLVFHFQEGSLVEAIRKGHWVLLDEINLATPETLNILSGLLRDNSSSITLTERGDIEPVQRHSNFRLFACMNPATDIGKRELPLSIRKRFTELYVEEADAIPTDLLMIIESILGSALCNSDTTLARDISDLYYELKMAVNEGVLANGNRQKPLFNLRTLTRPLRFAVRAASVYGIRQAICEGFHLAFIAQLDSNSRKHACSVLGKYFKEFRGSRLIVEKWTRNQAVAVFDHFIIETGPLYNCSKSLTQAIAELESQYVLTESVKDNIGAIARAIMAGEYPILLEGPTSSGKTSSVEFLARLSGNHFSRINNHEHTDLQEYIGSYVIDPSGRLVFKEGLLLTALRQGHWLVLDELNLAPSDVLEALNRLLDDNRELLVPELSEVIHPHPSFRLFATQNPAGSVYGGRKKLSRAFRSRFIEINIADIPVAELEVILARKAQIAPSQAKKLASVFSLLQQERAASANVFAGRHALVTLRDLFRWAERPHVTNEDIARNGFICLAERMRNDCDCVLIEQIICKVFRMESLHPLPYHSISSLPRECPIVWTSSMKRLLWLVSECIKAKEAVLLVGETGCGKTTIAQIVAELFCRQLIMLNCHQNTETSDMLGSQRPARSQGEDLFVWRDGPLVQSMREGKFFLLDEISLADDSVLERLNSVLEPSRTLTLAEAPSSPTITAAPEFSLIATMNPGGDYGKKELSPALRSRFTEIWVPSVVGRADIQAIIESRVDNQRLCEMIVDFWYWYMEFKANNNQQTLSLRDLSTWLDFITQSNMEVNEAFSHGAQMLFMDRFDDARVRDMICLKLLELSGVGRGEHIDQYVSYSRADSSAYFHIGPFKVVCSSEEHAGRADHHFTAPTAYASALKTIRAMQLPKPILLEGSPGVGKTALVSALASACGFHLCRINLSEQTELADLFGADLPVDGGLAGQFAWRDGPLLSALKRGHWVLLDELNLASQSVLEGLNACLDHRSAVYIPELDRTFSVSTQSRIFAAQNPVSQGGGRKGLPKSFVNRFSVVYCDPLSDSDFLAICLKKYPSLDGDFVRKAIDFNRRLNALIASGDLGVEGRPWEFNLRDLFRWFELVCSRELDWLHPLKILYLSRFRTPDDRKIVSTLIERIFDVNTTPLDWNIFNDTVQLGVHSLKRPQNSKYQLLQSQAELLESMISVIRHSNILLLILTGPPASGKSALVSIAAELMARKTHSVVLGPDTDSLDLLGSFEQVDLERHLMRMKEGTADYEKIKARLDRGESTEGRFEWVDGPLVRALEEGHWLILEQANTASPSVLDRINCLLEPNGELILSEQGVLDGVCGLRVVRPHPNFRLFMTMQTGSARYGCEISRAMRNRGVELAILEPCVVDRLAVMRSAASCTRNIQLPFSTDCIRDLRSAVNIAKLNNMSGSAGSNLSDAELFWKSSPDDLPLSISDGENHKAIISSAVLSRSDVHNSLKQMHANLGFRPSIVLLRDIDPMTVALHLSGIVWKAAASLYDAGIYGYECPPSIGDGSSKYDFYKAWESSFQRLSIRSRARAKMFEDVTRSGSSLAIEDYLLFWTSEASDVVLSTSYTGHPKGKWEEYLAKVEDFAVLKSERRSNFFGALSEVSPLLRQAFINSIVFKDYASAKHILGNVYLGLLLKELAELVSQCSLEDYHSLLSGLDHIKESLRLCAGSLYHADSIVACDLPIVLDWLGSYGDPNHHSVMHCRIQDAKIRLYEEDCLLQRRFLAIYSGVIGGEKEALEQINMLKNKAETLRNKIIDSDARESTINIISNASAFLKRYLETDLSRLPLDQRENLTKSLFSLRHSLFLQPANCLDLCIPILAWVDGQLGKLITSELKGEPSDDALYVLRSEAFKACRMECTVPLRRSLIQKLVSLFIPSQQRESLRYQGVQEDEEVEKEIEGEFFASDSNNMADASDISLNISQLFHCCAKPEDADKRLIEAECEFHRALIVRDHKVRVDSCLDYVFGGGIQKRANFYRDPQPDRLTLAYKPLRQLLSKADHLLSDDLFSGHDVLESIKSQAERFLNTMPVCKTSLADATVSLERLLQKSHDWEQYASQRYSLKEELSEISKVIISWRRLELASWRLISDQVSAEYQKEASKTWPWLAQLLCVSQVDKEMHERLVKLLEEFLMSGQLGQFEHRLRLLEDFACVSPEESTSKRLLECVIVYFKPICTHLKAIFASHKEPLESDLQSFLKTIHWTDATYWAMRSCVERSHRKMAQFVRKIRELMDRPVSSVLASVPFIPKMILPTENRHRSTLLDVFCDEMESRVKNLQEIDNVAQKQRALYDFLSVCKTNFGLNLTNRGLFDRYSDATSMLVVAANSEVDIPSFVNCLHQFLVLHPVAVSCPNPELGVRTIECLRALSGQLLSLLNGALNGARSALERAEWVVEESLCRSRHSSEKTIVVPQHLLISTMQSRISEPDHNCSLTIQDFRKLLRARTSAMITRCECVCSSETNDEYAEASEFVPSFTDMNARFGALLGEDLFSESQQYMHRLKVVLEDLVSLCYSIPLLCGSNSQMKELLKEIELSKELYMDHQRSLQKFVFVSTVLMTLLLKDGYCRKQEEGDSGMSTQNEEGREEKCQDGTGMADGQGEKNVNEEMEFEEQLTGLQGEEQTTNPVEREDNEIEMQQDFEAELEKLMFDAAGSNDDEKDDDGDTEHDLDDKKIDDSQVDSDAERQEIDKDWDDSAGDESASCVSSLEFDNPERSKELMAGEYDMDGGSTDDTKQEQDADGSESEKSFGSSSVCESKEDSNGVLEDLDADMDNPEAGAGEDELVDESDASVDNPPADIEDESEHKQDDMSMQHVEIEDPNTRAFDSSGADIFDVGVNDSHVATDRDASNDTNIKGADRPASKRTIHDILAPRATTPSTNTDGTLSASDRQQYEHAESGQIVSGPSNSNSDFEKDKPFDKSGLEEDEQKPLLRNAKTEAEKEADALAVDKNHGANPVNNNSTPSGVDSKTPIEQTPSLPLDSNYIQSLSFEVCEKLRLVLEPTGKSRMQGDYKTGKRLNLRKIIPFIASGYRRDKIWMRRNKPATRHYSILLCIDKSKSMREGGADLMATTAVMALRFGLEKLEAGSVSVIGFGDSIREVSFADTSATVPDDFNDGSSDFSQLLEHLLAVNDLENTDKDAPKLAIIISDGVCQDHERLRSLVNQLLSVPILPLLVIIDPQGRISQLTHVEYEGNGKVVFTKYLDTISFEHYIIVHDLRSLPALLADALQQWFNLV